MECMAKLSVVIITGNEEKFIADAVNSAGFINGAKVEPSQDATSQVMGGIKNRHG